MGSDESPPEGLPVPFGPEPGLARVTFSCCREKEISKMKMFHNTVRVPKASPSRKEQVRCEQE